MSNTVAKLPPSVTALAASMEQAASAIRNASGDMPFLRLLKSGEWVFGADDNDVVAGSLWAVDPASFCMGFQAWGEDADLLGEVTQLVTDQPVLRSDLKDVDGEWKPLLGCTLVCITGDDEGLAVSYKVTSKGGIKALGKLMTTLVDRIKAAPADGTYIPVVALGTESYKHKKYGRIYTPLLEVKEWTDEDELMAGNAEPDPDEMGLGEPEPETEPEPEPEPTPAKKRTRAAKKVVEPEPEEEIEVIEPEPEEDPAPTTRRRRRRAV